MIKRSALERHRNSERERFCFCRALARAPSVKTSPSASVSVECAHHWLQTMNFLLVKKQSKSKLIRLSMESKRFHSKARQI